MRVLVRVAVHDVHKQKALDSATFV
jgi:hypothetical protein